MGAGDDREFRRRGLRWRLIGTLSNGGIRLRAISVRIFQGTRENGLYEIYIPGIVLQNFDTHAVFNGHDRSLDGTPYPAPQLYVCGVREVYYDIDQGIRHKGMLRPDEKSANGKVA